MISPNRIQSNLITKPYSETCSSYEKKRQYLQSLLCCSLTYHPSLSCHNCLIQLTFSSSSTPEYRGFCQCSRECRKKMGSRSHCACCSSFSYSKCDAFPSSSQSCLVCCRTYSQLQKQALCAASQTPSGTCKEKESLNFCGSASPEVCKTQI